MQILNKHLQNEEKLIADFTTRKAVYKQYCSQVFLSGAPKEIQELSKYTFTLWLI
jgi:hypothetical protein